MGYILLDMGICAHKEETNPVCLYKSATAPLMRYEGRILDVGVVCWWLCGEQGTCPMGRNVELSVQPGRASPPCLDHRTFPSAP